MFIPTLLSAFLLFFFLNPDPAAVVLLKALYNWWHELNFGCPHKLRVNTHNPPSSHEEGGRIFFDISIVSILAQLAFFHIPQSFHIIPVNLLSHILHGNLAQLSLPIKHENGFPFVDALGFYFYILISLIQVFMFFIACSYVLTTIFASLCCPSSFNEICVPNCKCKECLCNVVYRRAGYSNKIQKMIFMFFHFITFEKLNLPKNAVCVCAGLYIYNVYIVKFQNKARNKGIKSHCKGLLTWSRYQW